MVASRGSLKRAILKEVYEANRFNAGKAPSRLRPGPMRRGYGAVGILFAALAVLMIWSLRPPSTEALHRTRADGLTAAAPAMVPYALPANAPDPTVPADYDELMTERLVPLAGLFGLGVKTVVIDPGHGGRDPGATGPNGLSEASVVLEVARRLKARLEAQGNLRVLLTRDGDFSRSLRGRVEFANSVNADLFISLHLNWLPQEPVKLIETYYFGLPGDDRAVAVAARENRHSEYSMADFEKITSRLGQTLKYQESYRLARRLQRSLFREAESEHQRVTDAGVKTAPFVVLLGADMPSVLAEMTCISNPAEARRLATPAYRDKLAAALAQGIRDYLKAREAAPLMTADSGIASAEGRVQ